MALMTVIASLPYKLTGTVGCRLISQLKLPVKFMIHIIQKSGARHSPVSRSAQAEAITSPPLSDQWLQCRDAIVRLVKALSPRQDADADADAGNLQLFKTAPKQLQALLNILVAAKKSNGTGLVCALAAVVGQWAQYVLQEHAPSAAVPHITDMSIGMLVDRVHLPLHG